MSSPVMLTVGKDTELSMRLEPEKGYNFTVSGRLLCDGQPVPNKQIAIKANGTVLGALLTATNGTYSGKLYLPAKGNKPTDYQVDAVFQGDISLNLTGHAYLPNGTRYAVCTTLQYSAYVPAANTVFLTVEPTATQATKATKTPEQMQQEAEQSGWLKPPKPRFSWEYPFFRLHFIAVVANERCVGCWFVYLRVRYSEYVFTVWILAGRRRQRLNHLPNIKSILHRLDPE